MRAVIGLALAALLACVLAAQASENKGGTTVPYPDGYRSWSHVKSELVTSDHPQFASIGGFHHIYANPEATAGYRSRDFPEGSVIVFDWIELRANGSVMEEGRRRRLDVMVRDSMRFRRTGGWGFQRFAGDSRTELAAAPTAEQCFACHQRLKKDSLVLSHYRE